MRFVHPYFEMLIEKECMSKKRPLMSILTIRKLILDVDDLLKKLRTEYMLRLGDFFVIFLLFIRKK